MMPPQPCAFNGWPNAKIDHRTDITLRVVVTVVQTRGSNSLITKKMNPWPNALQTANLTMSFKIVALAMRNWDPGMNSPINTANTNAVNSMYKFVRNCISNDFSH